MLKFEAETKSLRPRPKGPEAKAEAKARCYEAEAEAKILASRPVWPRGFNIIPLRNTRAKLKWLESIQPGTRLEKGIEPNPIRTKRTRTLIFERTKQN